MIFKGYPIGSLVFYEEFFAASQKSLIERPFFREKVNKTFISVNKHSHIIPLTPHPLENIQSKIFH